MDSDSTPESSRTDELHLGPLAADAAASAPTLTNRGAAILHGGEDTIVLALYIEWGESWSGLSAKFEQLKLAAGSDECKTGGFFRLGAIEAEIKAYGAGGQGKGPRRAYVLETAGLIFEFGRSERSERGCPNGKVIAGSLTCMQLGAAGVLALVEEIITGIGGKLVANKLSRIDGAVDLVRVDAQEFFDAVNRGCVIHRARRLSKHGEFGTDETLTIGKSPQLRIYDKTTELFRKNDSAKILYFAEYRWNGEIQTTTRVEFQLRRDVLKGMKFGGSRIDSLQDYLTCRAGVWEYMCNWFRLTKEPVNSNHIDRAETSDLWRSVAEGFQAWATSPIKTVRRFPRHPAVDDKLLLEMIVGCALSLCSTGESFSLESLRSALNDANRYASENIGLPKLHERWQKKRLNQLVSMVPEVGQTIGALAPIADSEEKRKGAA